MEITFSQHAMNQLVERKIARATVVETVNNPDTIQRQENGLYQAAKRNKTETREYLLIVIYRQLSDSIHVVTAFRTSKLKKYNL